jgi:hypothetical protein
MSLPRYHQVEMPMPAPKVPSIVFSCQKHPASLTTVLVNIDDPTALLTSASVIPLQSALRKTLPGGGGAGEVGVADWSEGPQPTSSAATAASAGQHRDNDLDPAMVTCPTAGWQ